jgi:hypothetical protein
MDNKIWKRIAYRMRYEAHSFTEYGQLSFLMGDGRPHLLMHGTPFPFRIFEVEGSVLKDRTHDYGLPAMDAVHDSAIADFDGDLRPDLFVTRAADPYTPEALLAGPHRLRVFLRDTGTGVGFKADGDLEFTLSVKEREATPASPAPAEVYIGAGGSHPDGVSFRLNADDPRAQGIREGKQPGIYIGYDREAGAWKFRFVSRERGHNLSAEILSTGSIRDPRPIGLVEADPARRPRLFLNTGKGFREQEGNDALAVAGSCLSVAAGDFDNDMDLDLYLVCSRSTSNLENILLENQGGGRFRRVEGAGGAAGSMAGRGDSVAIADYDRDGFLDLFVTNGQWVSFSQDGPHQLFRNRGNGNHWLEIDLQGTRSNRDAIGARVYAVAAGKAQLREQTGGIHRYSQHHGRIHFGLGPNDRVERLTVVWPDGGRQEVRDIPANRIIRLVEGAGGYRDITHAP